MAHHSIPQYYLKGFTDSAERIWAYDKTLGNKFRTTTKSIAGITNFYSNEVEQYLANKIEEPANRVLENIRTYQNIDEVEKEILARYMATMWKRVPRAKERIAAQAPIVALKISEKYERELSKLSLQHPEKKEFIELRKIELQEIIKKISKENHTEIWLELMPPEKNPLIVEAIKSMAWTFLTSDNAVPFLTCDDPVFYFTGIGVGNPESEITFPISSSIALWATWRVNIIQKYSNATKQAVKEINRRTVSNARQYVFHSRDEHWVTLLVTKGRWKLNRLTP